MQTASYYAHFPSLWQPARAWTSSLEFLRDTFESPPGYPGFAGAKTCWPSQPTPGRGASQQRSALPDGAPLAGAYARPCRSQGARAM